MSTKQPQSPLKKPQKSSNQQQPTQHHQAKKGQYSLSKSPFMTQGQKINFQSQDSQGSDISYESSIQSQEDINIGQIEYFKQEMGRFFINYPQLINNDLVDQFGDGDEDDDEFSAWKNGKQQTLNKNWALIADQILNEAKDSCSFLESLSHRIALYRSKIYQQDLIDILLKQQKNIMKEIQLEINLKKKESKGAKNTMMQHAEGCENVYFSWRKKKEIQNKMNLHREQNTSDKKNDNSEDISNLKNSSRPQHLKNNTNFLRDRANTLSRKKSGHQMSRSLNKKMSDIQNSRASPFFLTSSDKMPNQTHLQKKNSNTFHRNESKIDNKTSGLYSLSSAINKRPVSLGKNGRQMMENQRKKTMAEESQKQNNKNSPSFGGQQTFWKHLVNFESRTEAGRQLCELIRKTNNPNDQLGIKKTIMQFLVKNKQTVQNQIILKSTISQKIQKLYNDDSKQLLMFYPTKISTGQANLGINKNDSQQNQGSRHSGYGVGGLGNSLGEYETEGSDGSKGGFYQNMNGENQGQMGNKLFGQGEKFMHLLEDIVEGPLMKYWMMLQENKL